MIVVAIVAVLLLLIMVGVKYITEPFPEPPYHCYLSEGNASMMMATIVVRARCGYYCCYRWVAVWWWGYYGVKPWEVIGVPVGGWVSYWDAVHWMIGRELLIVIKVG